MKILCIHNYHRQGSSSGDDVVFNSETELLHLHGLDVIKYTVSNECFDNAGVFTKLLMLIGMFWSVKHYLSVKKLIQKENPDIVHIHTIFPIISPSVLYACKSCGKPVVATLHDTRLVCPNAISICNHKLCNKCVDGQYLRMIKNRCYKDSYLQSLLVSSIFLVHRFFKTFYRKIDGYICLNDVQKSMLIKDGYNSKKIFKKYNFVEDSSKRIVESEICHKVKFDKYIVYYGRLSEEKGTKVLEELFSNSSFDLSQVNLVVMGGGPLESEFEEFSTNHNNIQYLGYVSRTDCLNIVKNAEFIVFPSLCYEGCSMVAIETFSLGKSIIGFDVGFISELIHNGVNGYKVQYQNIYQFANAIMNLWSNTGKAKELGLNARQTYLDKFTSEGNFKQLLSIYKEFI